MWWNESILTGLFHYPQLVLPNGKWVCIFSIISEPFFMIISFCEVNFTYKKSILNGQCHDLGTHVYILYKVMEQQQSGYKIIPSPPQFPFCLPTVNPLLCQPEATTELLAITIVLSFLEFYSNEIMQYAVFCIRLLCLSIMFLRFIM